MNTFDIYFSDLKKSAQHELLVAAGIKDPSEANWDGDVFPVATVYLDDET